MAAACACPMIAPALAGTTARARSQVCATPMPRPCPEDRCPHRGMKMSFAVRGDHIACLYHGWLRHGRHLPQDPGPPPSFEVPLDLRAALRLHRRPGDDLGVGAVARRRDRRAAGPARCGAGALDHHRGRADLGGQHAERGERGDRGGARHAAGTACWPSACSRSAPVLSCCISPPAPARLGRRPCLRSVDSPRRCAAPSRRRSPHERAGLHNYDLDEDCYRARAGRRLHRRRARTAQRRHVPGRHRRMPTCG